MAAWRWQGLMYEGPVVRGAVKRNSGEGPWSAWLLHMNKENELIADDFATAEAAQKAVEARVNKLVEE
jgi:hypothetical protein